MKYIVEVNGQRVDVDLEAGGILVEGKPVHAHLSDIEGTPIHLVRIDDTVHRVAVRRGATRGRYTLWLNGYRFEAEALDERARAIREMTAEHAVVGPAPLVAPMPGLIVRVNVQPGDAVQAGQGLVVMEAMKMENELRAAVAGTVKAVRIAPGATVEKGAVLVELS
jgi:pyruvate carboxylase subunit B